MKTSSKNLPVVELANLLKITSISPRSGLLGYYIKKSFPGLTPLSCEENVRA